MAWSKKLTQLNDVLGDVIGNKNSIPKYVHAAGLKQQYIDTDGNAMDVWNSVLSEAEKHGKVDKLVSSVLEHYPNNPFLKAALNPVEIDYSLSPDIDDVSEWQPLTEDTLEVLTMEQSSLLPINFLALGVIKSKSVAKVEIRTSPSKFDVGTGFLFKVDDIDDIFFMTNFHVINRKGQFKKTRIIFDYELDIDGNSIASKSFEIDDNGPFYTSPIDELDVSIFKLIAAENQLKEYIYLSLVPVEVRKNDNENIIQHPGGEMKQISLYHNVVTNTSERTIQYLTDTLKGSSGAPVFNSSWEVVGLHHSGGDKKKYETELPIGYKSRNEGIQINKIIDFFVANRKK